MTDDEYFYENFAETGPTFFESYPQSVFPPPDIEVKAYHMERWYMCNSVIVETSFWLLGHLFVCCEFKYQIS